MMLVLDNTYWVSNILYYLTFELKNTIDDLLSFSSLCKSHSIHMLFEILIINMTWLRKLGKYNPIVGLSIWMIMFPVATNIGVYVPLCNSLAQEIKIPSVYKLSICSLHAQIVIFIQTNTVTYNNICKV